jgi:hypothetical protein
LGKFIEHQYTKPSLKRNIFKTTTTLTALVDDKIDQLKMITEEKWRSTSRQVAFLRMSWNPLRILVMRSGEILASLRSTKQLMGVMTDELPATPYLMEIGNNLPPIEQCVR